jgi:hypothetical protein
MGQRGTDGGVQTVAPGYHQAHGLQATGSTEARVWWDASGQGVLPGMEEYAITLRLRCRTPEETYQFVLVDGLTFVVPLEEIRRLRQRYPGVDRRLWELWAGRSFSRELSRACDRELEGSGL